MREIIDWLYANLKQIHFIGKISLLLGILCCLYAVLTRIFPIYFFWESDYIGLIFFAITGIFYCIHMIRQGKKGEVIVVIAKVILGSIALFFCFSSAMYFGLKSTEAHKHTVAQLKNHRQLIEELGEIQDIVTLPHGSFYFEQNAEGNRGEIYFNFIVKGSHKYRRVSVYAYKQINTDWEMEVED